MSQPARQPPSKFARYRASKRAKGMKLLRMWVPDPDAPGFREEMKRQAALINAAPDAEEVLGFLDAAWADLERDLPPYDWGPDGPPASVKRDA